MIQYIINLIMSFFKKEIFETKIQLGNKLTDILTFIVVTSICIANSILFLLFISLTTYYYIKEWHGDTGIALVCAASLNLITMLLILCFRNRWIKKPLSKIVHRFIQR